MLSLGDIFRKHGITFHCNADNSTFLQTPDIFNIDGFLSVLLQFKKKPLGRERGEE